MANITLQDLSENQQRDLMCIAARVTIPYERWERLFTLGLADIQVDGDNEVIDVLTDVGRNLLQQVEAAS